MQEYLDKAKAILKDIPKAKLYTYAAILVGLIGALVIGLSFTGKDQYHTLFAGLSTEDASMIVTKLKEQKVPYKLGMGGNTISVPKEKVYDVRLMLASQNSLPGGGGVGFELFDKTNYGMTEFMQNVNYKRAIQGELSRTINQMPEVKASRVHLAIPEKTLFTEKETEVTASVFLKLKPGKVLAKDQIGGIVQLVSGSIENLKPDNVSIIDSSGKILYKSGQADSPIVLSGQQYELQKNVEKRMEESIQSMLDKFIPASKSIVRANVELNLRKVEKMEEEYAPGKSAVTNEKKSREKSTSQNPKAGGVPGVASNAPQTVATQPGQPLAAKQEPLMKTNESEREESQISYEVSKSVRKIVEPFGDIKRVSLAIVLDGKYEKVKSGKTEELKYTPRSQKELNDVKNLVARAVGYNEERGDKIEVQNIPFETDAFADEKAVMEKAERNEMIFNMGKYVFYIAILLSLFLFVVRPILNMLKKRGGEALPLSQIKDLYVKGEKMEKGEKGQKGQLQSPQTPALEDKAPSPLAEAMKDKALVGSIIKEWVREGI